MPQAQDNYRYQLLAAKHEPLTAEEQAWVSDYLYREKLEWNFDWNRDDDYDEDDDDYDDDDCDEDDDDDW